MVKTKLIVTFVAALMCFALATGAFAGPSLPTPVGGKIINTGSLSGYQVRVTDTSSRNGDSYVFTTDEGGNFGADWGNLGFMAFNGDSFKFEALSGGSVVATKVLTFWDKLDSRDGVVFDLTGIVTPAAVTCPEPLVCSTCPDCPTVPECARPTQEACDALYPPAIVPTCPAPPVIDPTEEAAVAAVVALLAGAGGTLYVTKKATKKKAAKTTVKVKKKGDAAATTVVEGVK